MSARSRLLECNADNVWLLLQAGYRVRFSAQQWKQIGGPVLSVSLSGGRETFGARATIHGTQSAFGSRPCALCRRRQSKHSDHAGCVSGSSASPRQAAWSGTRHHKRSRPRTPSFTRTPCHSWACFIHQSKPWNFRRLARPQCTSSSAPRPKMGR